MHAPQEATRALGPDTGLVLFDPDIPDRAQRLVSSIWHVQGALVTVESPLAYYLLALRAQPVRPREARHPPAGVMWVHAPGSLEGMSLTLVGAESRAGISSERERLSAFMGEQWVLDECRTALPIVRSAQAGAFDMRAANRGSLLADDDWWGGMGLGRHAG